MSDIVIVQSKTITHESIPVVIKVINPSTGEDEKREITRSVIFENFKAEMPLKWAKYLIDNYPNEFFLIDSKDQLRGQINRIIRVSKEKLKGFTCEYCDKEAKSKAGLKAHIRYNHPDKWVSPKSIRGTNKADIINEPKNDLKNEVSQ